MLVYCNLVDFIESHRNFFRLRKRTATLPQLLRLDEGDWGCYAGGFAYGLVEDEFEELLDVHLRPNCPAGGLTSFGEECTGTELTTSLANAGFSDSSPRGLSGMSDSGLRSRSRETGNIVLSPTADTPTGSPRSTSQSCTQSPSPVAAVTRFPSRIMSSTRTHAGSTAARVGPSPSRAATSTQAGVFSAGVAAVPSLVGQCERVRGRHGVARAEAHIFYAERAKAIATPSSYVMRVCFVDGDQQDFFVQVVSLLSLLL